MEQYTKTNKGQGLIELILAVTILAIITAISLSLVSSFSKSIEISKQKLEAKYLLQQEIESTYAIEYQSWAYLQNGQYYLSYNPINNPPGQIQGWYLTAGEQTYNKYTEYITISGVYRENGNTISTNSAYPNDPNTKEVTATVQFTSFGKTYLFNESEYFTNWQQY